VIERVSLPWGRGLFNRFSFRNQMNQINQTNQINNIQHPVIGGYW
jgi:hypothetical protein